MRIFHLPIRLNLRGGNPSSSSARFFSSSSFTVKVPSAAPSSSWERGAKLVKNVDTSNKYLEHIRDVHDPSQHLKTLEDELRGTMGKALGKQGQKILLSLQRVEDERTKYVDLMFSNATENRDKTENIDENPVHNREGNTNQNELFENVSFQSMPSMTKANLVRIIKAYNKHRKDAEKARWELTVHRQAVGFIVGNHKFVQQKFPIPEPLTLPYDFDMSLLNSDNITDQSSKTLNGGKEAVVRNFGTQLDWWEKIGRWR
mmetsp:Transcript_23839/g.30029  ORF Transcript_23839/g.30029 Transcript_23839/m.30029 type:complete len:259 (+) Transcript_23839:102-878(+)